MNQRRNTRVHQIRSSVVVSNLKRKEPAYFLEQPQPGPETPQAAAPNQPNVRQIEQVYCPICHAARGHRCEEKGTVIYWHHQKRIENAILCLQID